MGAVKITGLESNQVLRQFRNIRGDTTSNASLVRKLEALANTQKDWLLIKKMSYLES